MSTDAQDSAHFQDLKVELGPQMLVCCFGRLVELVKRRRACEREGRGGRDGIEPCVTL